MLFAAVVILHRPQTYQHKLWRLYTNVKWNKVPSTKNVELRDRFGIECIRLVL